MKKIQIILLVMLVHVVLNAQNEKVNSIMLSNLEKANKAKTIAEFQDLANTFERIAITEKIQWTPWYYSSLYNIMSCVDETDISRKVLFIKKAQKMADEGLKLNKEETELMVLKVMAYFMEISVEQSKAMEIMPIAYGLIEQAKAINPENPRIYLIQAEAVYNTPIEFGGGKSNTLPIITIAKEKFDKFVPGDQIVPNWGKERCETILNDCSSNGNDN